MRCLYKLIVFFVKPLLIGPYKRTFSSPYFWLDGKVSIICFLVTDWLNKNCILDYNIGWLTINCSCVSHGVLHVLCVYIIIVLFFATTDLYCYYCYCVVLCAVAQWLAVVLSGSFARHFFLLLYSLRLQCITFRVCVWTCALFCRVLYNCVIQLCVTLLLVIRLSSW